MPTPLQAMALGSGLSVKVKVYTPGPPGYVSIVVIKRADADDPGGRGCCVQSAADDKLLPSKPSSVVDFAEEASPADPAAEA